MRYADAKTLVARARNKYRGKPLPGRLGQTRLVERHNGIAIRYVQTDVVIIHPDDSVTLNSNGWNTKTTRERMGYAEPVRVFTLNCHMYVMSLDGRRRWTFVDGMTFNAKGTRCINAVQLGVNSFTPEQFLAHVRTVKRERAKQRRESKRRSDELQAKWNAERLERERNQIVLETQPNPIVVSQPGTGLVWPTLVVNNS